ncbi:DsbA family protein [Caulobacter sp. 17J80-11]|uniref:DsbA family protein n=1 Tax=Caulobacter sp. 17J80-11 TaxID=2763502 RepID=UPI001653BEA5|nr:DsbA family protein [Caulobacter sp. 17J80-11]MBC6982289.1 DsbA family protein [Caulobacter sp. 17J80-11]
MSPTRRLLLAAAFALALPGAASAAEGDMSLGDPKAKVTVIEYASVTCSHCAHWQETVFDAFKAKYVDTGQVRYVLRELPTPPFEAATAGFMAARCAGDAKYFQVVDALLRSQALLQLRGGSDRWLRNASGLDPVGLQLCLMDKAALDASKARVEANAAEYGVNSTPTFIVNGRKLDAPPTLEELDQAIQPLLTAKAKKPKK